MRRPLSVIITSCLVLTLLLGVMAEQAKAGSSPLKWFSAASTNSTLVLARKGFISAGLISNTTATVYYLKLYDKATAPTCGTDIPKWTIPLPVSSVPVILHVDSGLIFDNGIGFCITGALADNDTTVAATGIVVNLGVSGR